MEVSLVPMAMPMFVIVVMVMAMGVLVIVCVLMRVFVVVFMTVMMSMVMFMAVLVLVTMLVAVLVMLMFVSVIVLMFAFVFFAHGFIPSNQNSIYLPIYIASRRRQHTTIPTDLKSSTSPSYPIRPVPFKVNTSSVFLESHDVSPHWTRADQRDVKVVAGKIQGKDKSIQL